MQIDTRRFGFEQAVLGEGQQPGRGRALMSNPEILRLDEPGPGLSPRRCRELFSTLRRVRALGVGTLLVERNAHQSLAIADRGDLIETGRLVGQVRADALQNDPAHRRADLGASAH